MIKLRNILKEAEAKITYTPEKIDEFVRLASKDLATGKKLFNSYIAEVLDMNVNRVIANFGAANQLLVKIKEIAQSLRKQHDRYFDIVDAYEMFEAPESVRRLEKIMYEIENTHLDLMDLVDALQSLLEASKKLKGFNTDTGS